MRKKTYLFFIGSLLLAGNCLAQSSVNTAGGEGSGEGGSISYSVGQVAVNYATSETGSISEGVQQTYSIKVVTNISSFPIELSATAHPNPTTDYLSLTISDHNKGLTYQILDAKGALLSSGMINSEVENIDFSELSTGEYFVVVSEKTTALKTFKILKN